MSFDHVRTYCATNAGTGSLKVSVDGVPGGTQQVILDLMTNDPGVGYSVASYAAAMKNLILHEQALGASVLVVVPPVSKIVGIDQLSAYTSALLDVARDTSVPVVNIQTSWGSTFNPDSGSWSADQIHPNTAGCAAEFALIAPALNLR